MHMTHDVENKKLILKAQEALDNSYAPYSGFKVGAAVLTDDNKIFVGCNIENVSFGATNCAERTAIFNAVSNGYKKIKKIAIVSSKDTKTYPMRNMSSGNAWIYGWKCSYTFKWKRYYFWIHIKRNTSVRIYRVLKKYTLSIIALWRRRICAG